jgi:hypothetical protein
MIENLNHPKHESNSPQGNTNCWKSRREGQIQELKFLEQKQQTYSWQVERNITINPIKTLRINITHEYIANTSLILGESLQMPLSFFTIVNYKNMRVLHSLCHFLLKFVKN